jgi:hypothetical protein
MSAARLSDRLRDELVRVADGDLRVAAPVDGADAAAQADFSVEGRVSASADGLRVAIRLRRAADDVYLWADHYLIPAGSVDAPPAWLRDVARIIEERAGRE